MTDDEIKNCGMWPLADAHRFIEWFLEHEPTATDWDKNRFDAAVQRIGMEISEADAKALDDRLGKNFIGRLIAKHVDVSLTKDRMHTALEKYGKNCPGCGRSEIHKMCPAWGTPYYMSGQPFTEDVEDAYYRELLGPELSKAHKFNSDFSRD